MRSAAWLAPETLGLDTRVEIRKAAIRLLEQMPEGVGRLVIDLGRTRQVDSAGLGALMLIQRRAAERRQAVVACATPATRSASCWSSPSWTTSSSWSPAFA